MKKIINLSFAIISLIGISSCSDDDTVVDTTKPTIEIITPTDHQEVDLGSVLNFKANLTDNLGLASYKIEIHSADDGHEHKGNTTFSTDFTYQSVGEIPGNAKNYMVVKEISVPADATQEHYHVGITVLDVNGNQNQQFVEIFIGEEHEH